jgi:signal transduction histidine kinase
MSHELRTPLNAIIGFSEILKEQMFGPLGTEQYLDYTVNIHESGQHLLRVITDILDVSRIEIGSMEIHESAVDIAKLCQSCIDMHQDQANHGKVSLHLNIESGMGHVNGDEIRLKQILINLLTNALKFTPEGGRVDVKAFINDNDETTLQVIDTGIGISSDKHQKILEPFEQVSDIFSREHEGSGLGLYLVKSFVTLHGGRFDIDSEIDQGSTFTITLPSSRTLSA